MTLIIGKVPPQVEWMKMREWFSARGYTYPQLPYIYQSAANDFKVRWDWCLFLAMMTTKNFLLLKNKDLGQTGRSFLSLRDGAMAQMKALQDAAEHMKTFEAYCVELGYNFNELAGYREDFETFAKIGEDYDLPYPAPQPPAPPPETKPQPKPPVTPPKASEPPKPQEPAKPQQPKKPIDWVKLALYIIGPILFILKCGK